MHTTACSRWFLLLALWLLLALPGCSSLPAAVGQSALASPGRALPAPASPPRSPEADGVSEFTPRRVATVPPPEAPAWYCFRNKVTAARDNGCGISMADCSREAALHERNAALHGLQFEASACAQATEPPWCYWVELDAQRRGYVCTETREACGESAQATSYHLLSDCQQAPRAGRAYAGSR